MTIILYRSGLPVEIKRLFHDIMYRLIFINKLFEGTVNAYRRNDDNTLTLVQVIGCGTSS